jgi:enoyl-CoA hydratase/carnithine racemase
MSVLSLERIGDCAVATLNRPDVLNAFSTPLLDLIDEALDQVEASDATALVFTGAGRAFCSGSDLSGEDAHDGDTLGFANARIARMHALLLRLIDFPKVSIAALNGLAYGGGLEFALGCTFRTASPGARLCLPEIRLGLMPSYGGTQLLPRLIGPGRALELMLTGESVEAAEAHRIGLVNVVDEDPVGAAVRLAGRLPGGAGIAQRVIRRCVADAANLDLAAALERERIHALEVADSEDARKGVERFLARKAARDEQ